MLWNRIRLGFVCLLTVAAVASRGGPAGANTNADRSSQAAKYLTVAAKLNRAQTQFASALTANPTAASVKEAAPPLAAVDMTCANTLAHSKWSGKRAADARAFEKYLRTSSTFLMTASYQTSSTVSSWVEQVKALGQSGMEPIAAFRRDLGLQSLSTVPPPSTVPATTTTTIPPGIGATVTLPDYFSVQLVNVIDSQQMGPETPPGDRLLTMELSFTNESGGPFDLQLFGNLFAYDTAGGAFQPEIADTYLDEPTFYANIVYLDYNGATATGWVAIDVPIGHTITKIAIFSSNAAGPEATWAVSEP